ncbi:hypothetical protein LTR66_009744 [Elasticomyces elasticus]|nr:hypothetical protein LTR66_009744 [Elasticomyces elasticus]
MSSSTRNTFPSVDSESKVDGMARLGAPLVEDHPALTSETDDDDKTVEAMKTAHLKGKEPPLGPQQDKEAKRSRADSDDDDDDDNKEIAAKKPKTALDEASKNTKHSTTTPAASQSHQHSYDHGDDDEQQQQQQQQSTPAKGKVPITCAHLQGHLAPAYVEQALAIAELMKQYE